jgi:uncharacterized protein YgiM (DUF1202 family)
MTLLVMTLLAVLLFVMIIGPQTGETLSASGKQVDSLETDVVDSSKEPTGAAIEDESGPTDVGSEIMEPSVGFQIKYDKYHLTYLYLLVQNESVNIRSGPSMDAPVLKVVLRNEKLNYIETVTDSGIWYHVTWQENGRPYFGFISADVVTKRVFRFDLMLESVLKAEKVSEEGPMTYIGNYHNLKGWAPSYQGEDMDQFGGRRSQSAPAYSDPANLSEFRYFGDGTLVRILGDAGKYVQVRTVKDDKVYYVPDQYVSTPAALNGIRIAVVIDRSSQNEAVFEKIGKDWKVISYTLATTGTTGEYHQPTPPGYFYAIERRERFYYYKDGTTRIQGYAPWAVRFAGGAYLHGVPVNYKFASDGSRIDPGKVEASRTLGTVPLSHKCVRNYTSHAKFLYDIYTQGEMIVIVLE